MKVKITVLLILCSCLLLLTQRTQAQEALPKDNNYDAENKEAAVLEETSAELPNALEEPLIEEKTAEIPRGQENKWNGIEIVGEKLNDDVTVLLETTETTMKLVTDSNEKILYNSKQEQENLENNIDAVKVALSQTSNRLRVEPQNSDNTVDSVSKDYTSKVGEERTESQVTIETKAAIRQERTEEDNRQTDVLVNEAVSQRKQAERSENEGELQVLENINEQLTDAEVGNSLTEKDVAKEVEVEVVTKDTKTDMDLVDTKDLQVSKSTKSVSVANTPSDIETKQIVKSVELTELQPANTEEQPNAILIENEHIHVSAKTLQVEDEEVKGTTANEDTRNDTEETTSEVTTRSNDESMTEIPKSEEENQDLTTENPAANSADVVTESTEPTTTAPLCTAPGRYAVENDCRAYITCTHAVTGELQRAQTNCPTSQAYDPDLQRCSRDLSPCTDIFRCELEGTYADPTDNTAYYWCVASRLSSAQHLYHIQCGNGQIFTPELGKCFVDMTNLQNLPLNYELYMSKSPDEECVREEVKVLRAEEKAKLKAVKLREKIQKKYEKELLKKAAKEAKEQAKLQGISLEEEMSTFVCTQEGSYVAAVESFYDYYICTGQKKGKFKVLGMKCAQGKHFSATQNICE